MTIQPMLCGTTLPDDTADPTTSLHYFRTKKDALAILDVVSKQPGNGGKKCYEVKEYPNDNGSKRCRPLWCLYFLPGKYRIDGKPVSTAFTSVIANKLSAWIQGYLYAQKVILRIKKLLF